MRFKSLGITRNFLAIEPEISLLERSQIAVVPAPYEQTVSYGGGTRKGPEAIITASHYVEFYDEELDRQLCYDVGIATIPPLSLGKKKGQPALRMIKEAVASLLQMQKFVVTLGGEHSISWAPIAAHAEKYSDLSVLQFDAHSDLRDTYQGSKYSHACAMARVCEVVDPRRLVQIGIRAQSVEEARFIREHGVNTFYAYEIRGSTYSSPERDWMETAVERLTENVYVTFDVDGFDPSIMPSTGTPEPNGLYWSETMRFLRMVAEKRRIVGFDVVELAPFKGVSHPDLTTARLIYKLMNYAFMKSRS